MSFEVEQKYHVEGFASVQAKLLKIGGQIGKSIEQVDTYFAHPVRDFASTDEALRLRRVESTNYVTYKGPKLDPFTKTRREIEIEFTSGSPAHDQFLELLKLLSFRAVADVRKQRRKVPIIWQQVAVEVALDTVDSLGTFVEIETLSDANGLDQARERIQSVASFLGLSQPERRSYLELLLVSQ